MSYIRITVKKQLFFYKKYNFWRQRNETDAIRTSESPSKKTDARRRPLCLIDSGTESEVHTGTDRDRLLVANQLGVNVLANVLNPGPSALAEVILVTQDKVIDI